MTIDEYAELHGYEPEDDFAEKEDEDEQTDSIQANDNRPG